MIASLAFAQQPEAPPWESEIRGAARSALEESLVPGLVLVVAEGGQIIISEALGEASIVGPTPMSRNTMLRMGALGDLGINLALLRLSDMGKLDLDAPIGQYADVHPALGRVTANQLIGHTAGLRANHFTQPLWEDADLSRAVHSWDEGIFVAVPGETYSHSHYSIARGGYLVEALAGKPFTEAMREMIWGPMGAAAATVRIRDLLTLPLGQGHWIRDDETQVIEPFGMGFIGWPNSLFASLGDLEGIALALAEPANGSRVRGGSEGKTIWTASTSWAGVTFRAVVDIERRFCALIADNGWGSDRVAARLSQTIRQVALGQQPPPPRPEIAWSTVSPSAHEQLIGVYENETVIQIALRDGKLVLESGPSEKEIMQGEENLFRAPIMIVPDLPAWPQTFSVEASSDGRARLLRIGSRVWARRLP
jgi:CubicO group peptidase (beta-lactamase class C family)